MGSRRIKHLFIADPWDRIRPDSDTTVAFVREVLRRGHQAFWTTDQKVRYEAGGIWAHVEPCLSCGPGELPQRGPVEDRAIRSFSTVWIRKDPPFDASYLSLCWLLCLEEGLVFMANRPSVLLRYHEKLLPFEALRSGFLKKGEVVPTRIGDADHAMDFLRRSGWDPGICKPFFGFAGSDVVRFSLDQRQNLPLEPFPLVQPFLEEITRVGDRRILYVNGKRVGDFVRLPKSGDFVSNLARGGHAELIPMTSAQKAIADRLGRFLKRAGIVLAGADMIGKRVSEVNITSPTGIPAFERLSGVDLSRVVFDYVERSAL